MLALQTSALAVLLTGLPATIPPAQCVRVAESPQPSRSPRWAAGWATIGSGFVLGLIGGAFVGQRASVSDEARSATDSVKQREFDDRAEQMKRMGCPLLGIGGAALLSGVVVLALPSKRGRSLTITPSGTGLQVGGTW